MQLNSAIEFLTIDVHLTRTVEVILAVRVRVRFATLGNPLTALYRRVGGYVLLQIVQLVGGTTDAENRFHTMFS